jgi:hypothetical protein
LKYRALIGSKEIFGIILNKPASIIRLSTDEERSYRNPKCGIKLPASIRIIRDEAVENFGDF